jgi:uncharacterized membrane protein YeaQ/YmgE (transglycosylase-associated protein family)
MTLKQVLVMAFVGLVAGFAASRVVTGHGYGVVGDIVVGVVGALVGAFILGIFINDHVLVPLGVAAGSLGTRIVAAFIGAIILLAVLHMFVGRGTRLAWLLASRMRGQASRTGVRDLSRRGSAVSP